MKRSTVICIIFAATVTIYLALHADTGHQDQQVPSAQTTQRKAESDVDAYHTTSPQRTTEGSISRTGLSTSHVPADAVGNDTPETGTSQDPPDAAQPPLLTDAQRRAVIALARDKNWNGFLSYLDTEKIDINARLNDSNHFRAFELWLRKPLNREHAERLLSMGSDLTPPDRNIARLMLLRGDPETVAFIGDRFPETLKDNGPEALLFAALREDTSMMELLMSKGVYADSATYLPRDIESLEKGCNTPEAFECFKGMGYTFGERAAKNAIIHGHLEALTYHAENGVDVSTIEENEKNALDLAVEASQTDVAMIRYLESRGFELQPRHLAQAKNNVLYENVTTTYESPDKKRKFVVRHHSHPHAREILAYIQKRVSTD